MQKLPTFHSAKHEFTHFAIVTMKNAMAVQAIENHLNVVAERINELIDRDSSVDLETFKAAFLNELETALTQNIGETEVSECELQAEIVSLKLRHEALTERVLKIEFALRHEQVESSLVNDPWFEIPPHLIS